MRRVCFVLLGIISMSCGPGLGGDLGVGSSRSALQNRDEGLTPGAFCAPSSGDYEGHVENQPYPRCRRNVSKRRKRRVREAYGIDPSQAGRYEIDHFIPLSIGGSNDLDNLWPLPDREAREKSRFEFELFERVSSGDLTQDEAVEVLRARW